jgi:ribosomal protein S18 acetylase RimI-like enzyme
MHTIRSIAPSELEDWARLADHPERWQRRIEGQWRDGTGRPEWCLVAEVGGRPVARVAVTAAPVGCGLATLEHRLAGLWFEPDGDGAHGAAVIGAALDLVPGAGATVDAAVNPDYMDHPGLRLRLLAEAGFRVMQEKEGFLWRKADASSRTADAAAPRSALAFRSIGEVGEVTVVDVLAHGVAGTLDRADRHYRGLCGPQAWGREMLGYLEPDDAQDWLVGYVGEEPAGYVLLGGFDEPGRATIIHIGVLPDFRGRGFGVELLREANRRARRRFTTIVSDVDVENGPMLRAMERAGHRSAATTWHVWAMRLER